MTVRSDATKNSNQIITLSSISKFIKSTPGTWNIPATNGTYNVIIRSADSTGGSGGYRYIHNTGGFVVTTPGKLGTKGGLSKVDTIIIESPVPGEDRQASHTCNIGSFILGNSGQKASNKYDDNLETIEPYNGGATGGCKYSGTITLSGEIEVVVGQNGGMPQQVCKQPILQNISVCGGLPGIPNDGYVEIIPIN